MHWTGDAQVKKDIADSVRGVHVEWDGTKRLRVHMVHREINGIGRVDLGQAPLASSGHHHDLLCWRWRTMSELQSRT